MSSKQTLQNIVPVILCGGTGTRLWPLSRKAYPKQFLALGDTDKSMLQETIGRMCDLNGLPPVIVTNHEHRFMVADHLQAINCEADILLEPIGRNTAPAIAAAALFIKRKYNAAHMLVLPSDHIIKNPKQLLEAVSDAYQASQKGYLVTFGIEPEYPETGYGYIHCDALDGASGAKSVKQFVEKPDLDTAKQYLESGNYLWNSGMFMFSADRLISELTEREPFMVKHVSDALSNAVDDGKCVALSEKYFAKARDISIDYALMEHSQKTAVVPIKCGWSDAGAWDSLWRISNKDSNGNVVHGNTMLCDTKNSHIHSDSDASIATLGLDNIIVVATKDVIMVADKSHAQDVKKLMLQAAASGDGHMADHHMRVYRPWGHYETIEMGNSHQVKHIEVKPHARLSVQSHNHRAEHWVIVSCKAKVRVGDRERIMTDNEYVNIPLGDIHCIENIGDETLKFIEVQHGDYLGEDDIVRYDDIYGRVPPTQTATPLPERRIA